MIFPCSKRWTHRDSAAISWTWQCFYHHIPARGFPRSLQGCYTQCLGIGFIVGPVLFIVSTIIGRLMNLQNIFIDKRTLFL